MISCVATEKSPNLSEVVFFIRAQLVMLLGAMKGSKRRKKILQLPRELDIEMKGDQDGIRLRIRGGSPLSSHHFRLEARGPNSHRGGSLQRETAPSHHSRALGRGRAPGEIMCVSLCQLAPPHPNPPANLLLICKVSGQDATIISPHPHPVDSRTSQRGEEWWENVGFRNKLNSYQQENH